MSLAPPDRSMQDRRRESSSNRWQRFNARTFSGSSCGLLDGTVVARGKSKDAPKLPETISHYTTLEGLRGIVDTGTLWASNASFLNDRAELEHALSVSEKVIGKFSSEKATKRWAPQLERVFEALRDGARPDTYVTCFCKDDDNLSQWRGYGGSEQGISVTFRRRPLQQRLRNENASFFEVSYSLLSTATKVHKALMEEIRHIADLDELVESLSPEDEYDELHSRISALLPRFKHLGFKDEREWRFAIQRQIDLSALQFRVSRNKIVPYVIIGKTDPISPLPIVSVRVGPGPDQALTARSVEAFIRARGYDVTVDISKIPFRP
jgi:hypothetical protein